MKFVRHLGVGLAVALVGIQIVPVERENPPVTRDIGAPPAVDAVLRRSCYDCHSNETVWPWYSRVAPLSWLVSHDVVEGRETLSFSTWDRYDAEARAELRAETWEEVEEGEMPPWIYTPTHPEARLDAADRAVLRDWVRGLGALTHADAEAGEARGTH